MKFITPFRIAGVLALLFCAAHTLGGMLSRESLGNAADNVFAAMSSTRFVFMGSEASWYGFWFGFGLMFSAFLLVLAFSCFVLDGVTPEAWPQVSPIAWALVVAMAFNVVISWLYFFAGPVVFSVLIATLIAVGSVRKSAKAA